MAEILSNNSIIQSAIEEQLQKETAEEIEKLDFNPLKMYFGDDYVINDKITIHQPSIQDFIDYGEANIYNTISPFTANTTGYRVQLWDMGIDWNKITNQELFSILIKTIDMKYSKIIFGDIDFASFNFYNKTIGGETFLTLYSPKMDLEIDENTMNKMCKYIQYMFMISPPEEEFTSSKILKQELINNDKQKQILRLKEINEKGSGQSLLSMISFCVNHPGFKYKKNELREVGIVEFMDSVKRLQIYESARALLNGRYSGMCDLSKVNPNEFNFMRDVKVTA